MKEASGEGSMTIITIVIIALIAAAGAAIVGLIMNQAKTKTDDIGADVEKSYNEEYNKTTPTLPEG